MNEKAQLRNQIANIDWDAEQGTEGRELALALETVLTILAEEEGKIREASSRLQDGLREEEVENMDYQLDRSSSNIEYALERFDEIRLKLF